MVTPKLIPARSLEIGYFIREQMEFRNWDRKKLADKLNIDTIELYSLLENNRPLTIVAAKALAKVFGSSYQYWMNLDSKYSNPAIKNK